MALDVYFKEDVLNVLRALHVSSEVPAALAVDLLQEIELAVGEGGCDALPGNDVCLQEARMRERMLFYQKGFRTALASVALAFGLVPVASAPFVASVRKPSSVQGEPYAMSDRFELDLRSFIESMACAEP